MAVFILHEPSERFLGPGLRLVAIEDALAFDDHSAAQQLLDRHASEPCFVAVDASLVFAA